MGRLEKFSLGFLALLAVVPFLLEAFGQSLPAGYILRILSSALMLSSLALAQNILLGYTGYPAFGAIAFFGVGGYASAILAKSLGLPMLIAMLGGGVVACLFAVLLAPVVMRLKSHYFAIATLALQLALGEVVANLEFTGGADGINLPIYRGFLQDYVFYLLFLFLTALCFGVNLFIDRSLLGYALKAIREDEVAAESMGVNTVLFKSYSFAIMAFLTGLCGAVYAYWITYIDPPSMFDPLISVKMFVALLLGGIGTTTGPLLGGFLFELVSELVWSKFTLIHGLVLGLIITLSILLFPKGLVGVRR